MARQFDVFRPRGGTLVVVIQSDLLEVMRTRVVAPLLPVGRAGPALGPLNPEIVIGSERLVFVPQLLATLTTAELGEPIGSISHRRDEIVRALDALLSGI